IVSHRHSGTWTSEASSTNPASGPATTSSPWPRRVSAPMIRPPATTARATAAMRVASSQTRPPSVDRPAATAAAMSARPSVIMVSRDLRAGLSSPATWMPGSGRSHAKGAAPSGSHDGGTGGPYGAPGPEPGSWDGPWAAPGWAAPSGPPPYPAPGARGADTSAQPTGGSGERRYRPYQPASIAAVMR